MKKVKKVHIKPKFVMLGKVVGFIIICLLCVFIFYRIQIGDLKKLGYSEKASNTILFSKKKRIVMEYGKNKTLNLAFESDNYREDYIDNYAKIKYVNHEHLIDNIHRLLKVGYSNNDINVIMAHGTDESVREFAKRKRVRYLDEFFSYDFAKLENYDRYVAYSDETGENEYDTILYVNLNMDQPDYESVETVTKFSIDMLVNKHHNLEESFVPSDLTVISKDYTDEDDLQCSRLALNAFIEMNNAAVKDGYSLVINSAYRSYQEQVELTQLYLDTYGQSYVDKFVAKPGFSEHQTGLALDIGSRNARVFEQSKEFEWMQNNAYKYGFIYRFDERYQDLTGFRKEPWHYRYVGKEIAKYIYEHNNMSLEEYYVLFLEK